jgi:pimeloyl-ACP methyl ester carboxylesterase
MNAGAMICGSPDASPVMLIHGLGSSFRAWDRVVPLIESAARVYAVELDASRSIESDADAVAALIEAPTVLVGHSRGGLVATAIAERHPGLVRRLILICPSWSVASRTGADRPIERALATPVIGDVLWALASDSRQRSAVQSAFAPGTPVPYQFVVDVRARGRRALTDSSRAIDDYLRTAPLAERLKNLSMPTELVFGEKDARVSAPRDEFSTLRNTHLTELPGVGHSPPWEAPDKIAEMITTSVANWPSARTAAGTVAAAQQRKAPSCTAATPSVSPARFDLRHSRCCRPSPKLPPQAP